jgi:hypothetical protein
MERAPTVSRVVMDSQTTDHDKIIMEFLQPLPYLK